MSAGIVNVPIVFRGPNGAAAGVAAQHSQCFGAWYSHCPGLKVYFFHVQFNSTSLYPSIGNRLLHPTQLKMPKVC